MWHAWHTMYLNSPLKAIPRGDLLRPQYIHDGEHCWHKGDVCEADTWMRSNAQREACTLLSKTLCPQAHAGSCRLFRAAQWHASSSVGGTASPCLEWCIMRTRSWSPNCASELLSQVAGTLSQCSRSQGSPYAWTTEEKEAQGLSSWEFGKGWRAAGVSISLRRIATSFCLVRRSCLRRPMVFEPGCLL